MRSLRTPPECCRTTPIASPFLAWASAFLVAADLVLAFTGGIAGVAVGVALWGLHMGFTQGLLATLVADTAPPELRGTAYGIFNLLGGLALLVASVLAGALWDSVGSQATFLAGAAFTATRSRWSCRNPAFCADRRPSAEILIFCITVPSGCLVGVNR